MKRLADKVTIVTGSSSGIGKAIARVFGREGASVVVAARRQNLCEQTVAQIHADGGQAISIPTDVTDELQVDRLISDTVRRFGRLDILVNNGRRTHCRHQYGNLRPRHHDQSARDIPLCSRGVADELAEASPGGAERSGAISPFDVAESCVYLATLGPNAIVQQIVLDRMMADW